MFRFAQHDIVTYDISEPGTSLGLRKHFVRSLNRRGLFPDADENHRNRPGAGGHQRPAAAYARGRNHLAAYISCVTASQLSAVLLGPARLAYRHVDAADRDELVRLPNHKLKAPARRGVGGWICADDAFIDLGRRAG